MATFVKVGETYINIDQAAYVEVEEDRKSVTLRTSTGDIIMALFHESATLFIEWLDKHSDDASKGGRLRPVALADTKR